jgi:hypothetical protein
MTGFAPVGSLPVGAAGAGSGVAATPPVRQYDWPVPPAPRRNVAQEGFTPPNRLPLFVATQPNYVSSAKFNGYAALSAPQGLLSPKFLGYAALAPPQGIISPKFLGYVVLLAVPLTQRYVREWPNPRGHRPRQGFIQPLSPLFASGAGGDDIVVSLIW